MHYTKVVRPEKPKPTQRRAPSRNLQQKEFKKFYDKHENIRVYLNSLLRDGFNRFNFTRTADSPLRDMLTVDRRLRSEGIGFATIVLPRLFQSLLDWLEHGKSDYPGFRKAPGGEYPAFMQQYFSRIYDVKTCEKDRAMYIDHVYQVSVAFKKLKGPYRNNVLRKQLADFVETDISLRYVDFLSGPKMRAICDKAERMIFDIFKNVDVEEQHRKFVPRPGPGATNTNVEKHLRFRPHVLYKQLDDVFPYDEWFYSHPWDIVAESYKHPYLLPVGEMPTSRFKFVPKTFSKPRGICIEQLETQYLQQAIKKGLYDVIESHPLTKGKVNFARQDINGGLAVLASLNRLMATLDMKEASDRIIRKLVRRLFRRVPQLCKMLMALSTRIIELPDEINFIKDFPTAKFAPMGSALCFPVMAIVHFVLIRAICQEMGFHEQSDSIYVYGDDIIAPSECVEAIYEYLPKFGMKFNTQKSYYKSYFRESCGTHAYYGKTITPVYFKHTPNTNMDLTTFISCLQTERQLYKKGYYETASELRRELRTQNTFGFELPYVPVNSVIPGFIREDLSLLRASSLHKSRRRWDSYTQCFEYRIRTVAAIQQQLPPINQNEGLLRWKLMGTPLEVTTQGNSILTGGISSELSKISQGHVSGSLLRLSVKTVWLRESAFIGETSEDNWDYFPSMLVRHNQVRIKPLVPDDFFSPMRETA